MNWTRIKIKNDLSELNKALDHLQKFSDDEHLDHKTRFNLHLALDELLNNIISYGYGNNPETNRFIEVGLCHSKNCIDLEIMDDANEWDLTQHASPDLAGSLEEKKIGGLGVHLVKNLFDGIEYKRENGRNILTMRIATIEKN